MTKSEMRLERATRIFIELIKLPDLTINYLTETAPKKAMVMAIKLENDNDVYEEITKESEEKSRE